MKYLFFSLFILFSFSSCMRDYYCQCTYTYSGSTGLPPKSGETTTIHSTRNNANATCQGYNQTIVTTAGDTTYINCNLY